jgi:hypothetical protein
MDPTEKWFIVGAKILGSYWVASVISCLPLVEDSHGMSAAGMFFILPMFGPVAIPQTIAQLVSGKPVPAEVVLIVTIFFVSLVICLIVAFRRNISALRKKKDASRS